MPVTKIDILQVRAFHSLYRAKKRSGLLTNEECFAEAIVQTSDDVFAGIKHKNKFFIDQWYKQFGRKKEKQYGKEEDECPF